MKGILYPACALLAWSVFLTKARHLPAMRREPAQLVTWIMYVLLAMVFTGGSPVFWNRLDGWSGLAESATLITQCCVVAYSGSALVLLLLWSHDPAEARQRIRRTVAAVLLSLVVMIGLFLHSDPVHQHEQSFVRWYGGSSEYDSYLLVYLAVYTATMVEVVRLCWRYAQLTTPSWLRSGLITASVGALIGLGYAAGRLADIVAARAGIDLSAAESLIAASASLGAMLVMSGLSAHSWGPRVSAFAAWVRRLRAYVQLRPLWVAFYARDPGIAFETPLAGAKRWWRVARHPTELDYRIGRRVVEIRDGIVDLHPYVAPEAAVHAREYHQRRGLDGDDLAAAVEADQIRAALQTSTRSPAESDAASPPPVVMNLAPADLDAEIAWLVKVARAFTHDVHPLHSSLITDPRTIGES